MIDPMIIQVRLVLHGTLFRNTIKILCHPICNRLYIDTNIGLHIDVAIDTY